MTEKQLHKQICDYIHLQYPKVIFNTDMSGLKLSIGEAVRAKKLRSSNGFPDIQILETREINGCVMFEGQLCKAFHFCGLFLEIKIASPFKKNNTVFSKYKHQDEMHKELRKRGYLAVFVWSFEMAKEIIDKYLKS